MSITSMTGRGRFYKVFICAVLFRLAFLIWSWTPWLSEKQDGMSRLYFEEGYGLDAGYGYISSQGQGGVALKALYAQINSQERVATSQTAPPLPKNDVHYEMLHPPGMAILVAALHWLTHRPADLAVELVGLLLDSFAAVLLCWLVSDALSPEVGWITGLIYAFFPPVAFGAAASRAPEGIMAVFIIGAVVCVWLAMNREQVHWLRWCLIGGGVLGVGCYFRPDYLLLPVALGLGAWMMSRRFWISLRNLLVVQLVALVALFPWAWRNQALSGRWIFTSTSVGATLITGLGEYHNPWGFGSSDIDRGKEAAAQGIASPWEPDADVYFRKLFWQSIEEKPAGYLESVVKRIPLALAPPLDVGLQNPFKDQSMEQVRVQQHMDRFEVLRLRFGHTLLAYADELAPAGVCLAALMADGYMFWRERRRWGLCLFLLSTHFYGVGTHLLTHFEPRFLLPGIWSLLIGLGYVADAFWRHRRNRQRAALKRDTALT